MDKTITVISNKELPEKNEILSFNNRPCPFCGETNLLMNIMAFSGQDISKMAIDAQKVDAGQYISTEPITELAVIVFCKKCKHYHMENVSVQYTWLSDVIDFRYEEIEENVFFLSGSNQSLKALYYNTVLENWKETMNLTFKEADLIKEADISFNLELYTGASACYRSALEHILNRKLLEAGVSPVENLVGKIDQLRKKSIIADQTCLKMKAIAYLGNDNLHTKTRHKDYTVSDLRTLFYSLLQEFVETETIKRIIRN